MHTCLFLLLFWVSIKNPASFFRYLPLLLPLYLHSLFHEEDHAIFMVKELSSIVTTSGFPKVNMISLRPRDAYLCNWIGSSVVQVMACRLFGAISLPEPMLSYRQLDPWQQTSVKFYSKFKYIHLQKWIWKCCLQNGGNCFSALL